MTKPDIFRLAVQPEKSIARDLDASAKRLRGLRGMEVAYSDEADSSCPAGELISECTTAIQVMLDTKTASEQSKNLNTEGDVWTTYAWTGHAACAGCGFNCEGSALIRDNEPTGLVRLAFMEPDDSIPTIKIDLSAFCSPLKPRTAE